MGRLSLPKISIFLVVVAGTAGNDHEKAMILGGLAALQTSLRRHCVTGVIVFMSNRRGDAPRAMKDGRSIHSSLVVRLPSNAHVIGVMD